MSIRNLCSEQKYENYQRFLPENFHFLEVKFSIYLNRRVLVMATLSKEKAYICFSCPLYIQKYKCKDP